MALHHLELSWEQLASRYSLSRYTPGIIQDVIPPGISPPAEGERSPVYSPVPPSISVVLFEEDSTATAVIGKISVEKGPGQQVISAKIQPCSLPSLYVILDNIYKVEVGWIPLLFFCTEQVIPHFSNLYGT